MKNTHQIELPDGRLITVQGGNAEAVANIVAHKTGGGSGMVHNETPLEMPAMNFTPPTKDTKRPAVVIRNGGETPLVMPALQF